MAKRTHQLLAESLEKAKKLSRGGCVKGSDLDRPTRERLTAAGYLASIMRGWYLLSQPDAVGSTAAWFGSIWDFLSYYLSDRFGEDGYCLSAESSLDLHTGDPSIGQQIVILTNAPANQSLDLPHDTSIFLYQDKNFPETTEKKDRLNLLPFADAIVRLSPSYFERKQRNVEIALKTLSIDSLSRALIESGSQTAGARIIGSLLALKDDRSAERLKADLKAAGISITPQNPFRKAVSLGLTRIISPYSGRIESLWNTMRSQIIAELPEATGQETTIELIEQTHTQDAYHSLSIEGYEVSEDLIERIAAGKWDPQEESQDRERANALAARGYLDAFKAVMASFSKVQSGHHVGDVIADDLQEWYRAIFTPSAQSGIIPSFQLAGYRNGPVYIKGSRHVPPPHEVLPYSMEKFFELIRQEEDPRAQAILGHFVLGFIHPFPDGNGRLARFLMNLALVAGGYPWTIIRVENRPQYMQALEAGSCEGDLAPFARFVASEMCGTNPAL